MNRGGLAPPLFLMARIESAPEPIAPLEQGRA